MAEKDIREAARPPFTGWKLRFDLKFVVNKDQHDERRKTFSWGRPARLDGVDSH